MLTLPDAAMVNGAMEMLRRMGAPAEGGGSEQPTGSGRHPAPLPVDLRCGKLLAYGATFGCLKLCLTIAAVVMAGSPFVVGGARVRTACACGQGNILADLYAVEY